MIDLVPVVLSETVIDPSDAAWSAAKKAWMGSIDLEDVKDDAMPYITRVPGPTSATIETGWYLPPLRGTA